MISSYTDDELDQIYKDANLENHSAALRAIYNAGLEDGLAGVTPDPTAPTPPADTPTVTVVDPNLSTPVA